MRSICFYFQVHQPFRLRLYRFFDIGKNHDYFDEFQNRYIARRVADKCYLPTNKIMLDLIKEYGTRFKISYSISGTAIDQFSKYTPDVIDSFKNLAETGCVEFLAETYTHSLSALKSKEEFEIQVMAHKQKIKDTFGVTPVTFRNTELIYSDEIGAIVSNLGFNTMLTEGAKHILGWKSPNYMYCNAINPKLKLLLKNFQLSDDIAFRFSQSSWNEWPLTTEKYVEWLNAIDPRQEVVNLFMDYETFGEHQWPETGIFQFLKALPAKVFSHSNFTFNTPNELSNILQPVAAIHVPHPISWADEERDLTAWLGNDLQDEAFDAIYAIEHKVKATNNFNIIAVWRYLQTSDHFYYMCTKWFSDGDVHKYFNPYGSPYEAFINYMNVISDFEITVNKYLDSHNIDSHKFIETPNIKNNTDNQAVKKITIGDFFNLDTKAQKKIILELGILKFSLAFKNSSKKYKDAVLKLLSKKQIEIFNNTLNEKTTKTQINDAKKELLSLLKL